MSSEDKRFVIQKHTSPKGVHWDFMLEKEQILHTYRLDKSPRQVLRAGAEAEKIFDHPIKFLTYEGPVKNGQDSVCIAEAGTYRIIERSSSRIELELAGGTLKGKFVLAQIEGDSWRLFMDSDQGKC